MYVELHSRSAFSFLRGASSPEQMAEVAAGLGLPALALCDRDGVCGAPRFFTAARECGLRPIIGAELTMEDGSVLPVLVESRAGYQNLCRLLTRAKLRSPKGDSAVTWEELPEFAAGLVVLTGDEAGPLPRALARHVPARQAATSARDDPDASTAKNHAPIAPIADPARVLETLVRIFGSDSVFVEIQRHRLRAGERVVRALADLAEAHRLPLLATNGVCYATPAGRQVLDVFTCVRHHTHLDAAGLRLSLNSERRLKSPVEMADLFRDLPAALTNTLCLAERLQFTLADLGYEFPKFPVPTGETMDSVLRQHAFAGARERYGKVPEKVRRQLERELELIAKLGFAGYFLIVADLIRFCREHSIMAQGRGSAANSTVCFCLGITAVDPLKFHTLFERFLSEGRKAWPDIDIDLPSGDRREQVIQEVYRRYGRHGAAMTANVITYRGRSAAREIGKALNFSTDVLERFSNLFAHGDFAHPLDLAGQMEQAGLPRLHPRARAFATLYPMIHGLPRHLGQHSGGMVICQGQLDSIVPLENAAMPGRTVMQWDKDDCEDLGIIKVDLLGLGMMSLLQDAIALTRQRGHPVDLARIPGDDPATYAMMQRADTIGVFQIESRAQMATLPRMRPSCFYDVVIEVAIIRPGPIQGRLMHPYLARRQGREPVTYYHESLRPVLERTLGVPLFQEQMLQIAMVMADCTGHEAEELRRALSFHRSHDRMQRVEVKLRAAMQRKGVPEKTMGDILAAISSFALYGFPESHAISFALLAYASAYLKTHFAPEFYTSLLNNQPMGFYSPATIVQDARRHGQRIRPVCVARSDWTCRIEADEAVRLGLCVVQGLRREHAQRLLEARAQAPFASLDDFKRRAGLNRDEWRRLAEIGALNSLAEHRRAALWEVEARLAETDLFSVPEATADGAAVLHDQPPAPPVAPANPLRPMDAVERLRADYDGTQLTLGPHPMASLRPQLPKVWRASDLPRARDGQFVRIAGNVICRQRPGTAKGFVFISLEDETGVSNAIVAPALFEKFRLVITEEPFLQITGRLQARDGVIHIQARHIARLPARALSGSASHDFH